MLAWVILKTDFENDDEIKLATAELSSILLHNNGFFIDSPAPESLFLDVNAFSITIECGLKALYSIIERISYWKGIVFGQEQFHSTAGLSDFSFTGLTDDYVMIYTKSFLQERSAEGKAALKLSISPGMNWSGRNERIAGAHPRKRNTYATHDIHKYKAKFFPRLARALVNIVSPDDNSVVLDPFCGSGTLNLECSLMGMTSFGTDIDPLSIEIASLKCDLLEIADLGGPTDFEMLSRQVFATRELSSVTSAYRIPDFLRRERSKSLTPDVIEEIELDINAAITSINLIGDTFRRRVAWIILSDALASKISLRWMGTGDDRFAIEVAKRSIRQIAISHGKTLQARVESFLQLPSSVRAGFAKSTFYRADASRLPLDDGSVSSIVTSPPYLPASSGRETYLRSRAASITALNLEDMSGILKIESDLVGSLHASVDTNLRIPPSVVDLVNFMLPQRSRVGKAIPTKKYFEKLGLTLIEMGRVLAPGGRIAMVISKSHTFYEQQSRAVVRVFDMVEAVTDLVNLNSDKMGLSVESSIDLELGKADYSARPASTGAYFESVLFIRKLEVGVS